MKIGFLRSDKPREGLLADAFLTGARRHGHETEEVRLGIDAVGRFDVVCMVGVKSKPIFDAHLRAGTKVLYFDKGYCRHKTGTGEHGWEFWRVAINAHHPTRFLSETLPDDRWNRLGLEPKPWRHNGSAIVIAGSSAKYHEFYGLKAPTAYAAKLVTSLKVNSDRAIIYRPKPSWREARPVRGARYSRPPETIGDVLDDAHVMVTHGSNACFEAMLAGVPTIVLGDAVAKPISSTSMDDVEDPILASDADRARLLADLAYWQWTRQEMVTGEAWDFIGDRLHA